MAVRIGELLLKEKKITPTQLQEALGYQKANGGKLAMNAAASDGQITVRVSGPDRKVVPGFDHGDCNAFVGDSTAAAVTWKGKSIDALKGQTIRLEFFVRNGDLYSFRATP